MDAFKKTIEYLSSDSAHNSIVLDPYWPKWNSPWWHLLLLYELGEIKRAPVRIIEQLTDSIASQYLDFFPIHESELPQNIDPYRHILCFCAAGSCYQMLHEAGIDVDNRIPWLRSWFTKYQMKDGGFNCDDNSYRKENGKSSIVSTLPCLEALLFCCQNSLSESEHLVLRQGAEYLLSHRLIYKKNSPVVINSDWTEIRFPRFYEYDFLRGFYFLWKYREYSGMTIPDELTDEVEQMVNKQIENQQIVLRRYNLFDRRSYGPNQEGSWSMGVASEFELFKAVSYDGAINTKLTELWNQIAPKYLIASEAYQKCYPNPIKLDVGDRVEILKRETNSEWLGWVYCRNSNNVEGWVSEKKLLENGNFATAIFSYDASELNVEVGETLKVYFNEAGWSWCKNSRDQKGWVPNSIFME